MIDCSVDWVAVIAALAALAAFGFSVFVYCQNRKLLAPVERPMFAVQQAVAENVKLAGGVFEAHFPVLIKNVGRRAANKIRVRIGYAPLSDLSIFKATTRSRLTCRAL